jgi:hypothetical protein
MVFELIPLRLRFMAREAIDFNEGSAANVLRGALGTVLDTKLFAPGDLPRPFVFRARHLDGCTFEPGETFYFDLHVFSREQEIAGAFNVAFGKLADIGLGPKRSKLELLSAQPDAPKILDLDAASQNVERVRVEFLSPTELKHGNEIAARPEFGILFARIRDRIDTLRSLYGPGPLEIDFRAMGERAGGIRMTRCEIRRKKVKRRSSRTGHSHSLGGFTGVAEYQGDLGEFLPYLGAAQWIGVGRHAVWGKGEIAVTPDPAQPVA